MTQEDCFNNYIKTVWPGFAKSKSLDYKDTYKFETIKEAFEAGWNAKTEHTER